MRVERLYTFMPFLRAPERQVDVQRCTHGTMRRDNGQESSAAAMYQSPAGKKRHSNQELGRTTTYLCKDRPLSCSRRRRTGSFGADDQSGRRPSSPFLNTTDGIAQCYVWYPRRRALQACFCLFMWYPTVPTWRSWKVIQPPD